MFVEKIVSKTRKNSGLIPRSLRDFGICNCTNVTWKFRSSKPGAAVCNEVTVKKSRYNGCSFTIVNTDSIFDTEEIHAAHFTLYK